MSVGGMARRPVLAGLVAAFAATIGCADDSRVNTAAPSAAVVSAEVLRVDTLASGLAIPWGIAEAPDGRLFVTERAGRLRVISAEGLRREPLLSIPVHAEDKDWHPESGLMGIALDPEFSENGRAYVMATFARAERPATPTRLQRILRTLKLQKPRLDELAFESRILRLRIEGDRVAAVDTLVRGLPAFHYHAGGAVSIGPDGRLYVTVGDVRLPQLAGDSRRPIAAVLRYERDGSIPRDNPDPASPVWAVGLRNTQALLWTAEGSLFGVDHGPSGLPGEGGRAGRDELNYIEGGRHYGWPTDAGPPGPGSSVPPLHWWSEAVAPAGLARGPSSSEQVVLLVGRLRGGIEQLSLESLRPDAARDDSLRRGWRVSADTIFPLPDIGRVRSLLRASDGSLYVTTSNRDIRGTADSLDDLVVRVRRAASPTAP